MTKKKIILIILATILVIFVALVALGALTSKNENNSTWDNLKSFKIENKEGVTYLTSKEFGISFLIPKGWIVGKRNSNEIIHIITPDAKEEDRKLIKGCGIELGIIRNKGIVNSIKNIIIETKSKNNGFKEIEEGEKIKVIKTLKTTKNNLDAIMAEIYFPNKKNMGSYFNVKIPFSKDGLISVISFTHKEKCKNNLYDFLGSIKLDINKY